MQGIILINSIQAGVDFDRSDCILRDVCDAVFVWSGVCSTCGSSVFTYVNDVGTKFHKPGWFVTHVGGC